MNISVLHSTILLLAMTMLFAGTAFAQAHGVEPDDCLRMMDSYYKGELYDPDGNEMKVKLKVRDVQYEFTDPHHPERQIYRFSGKLNDVTFQNEAHMPEYITACIAGQSGILWGLTIELTDIDAETASWFLFHDDAGRRRVNQIPVILRVEDRAGVYTFYSGVLIKQN